MGRSKYRPWLDLPDDASILPRSVEDRIRSGYPAFERLPTGGDWFRGRLESVRVRVSTLFERDGELRVRYFSIAENGEYSLSFRDFMLIFALTAGQPNRTVMDGITPAKMLADAGLTDNDLYHMTLAVESGHGRWLGIYRHLGITIPPAGARGCCPLCAQSKNDHASQMNFRRDLREDAGYGMCHCLWCGQHSGIDLIAGSLGLTLDEAATAVLGVTGQQEPEAVRHAQR